MKLLTWNACRLLAGGRELALLNILTSTGADVATITECEILEGTREFSVAGYTTFSLTPSLQGGKTRVIVLVMNALAVRANVKVIKDIMDPAVQSVWLQFSHHRIGSGSSTLGAFILGGIYREWTPLLSWEESKLRLEALLHHISKAADGRVVIHGNFNVNLDRVDDSAYYMATLAKTLTECTSTAGLETHTTSHTFRSYGNFTPAGDLSRPPGDVADPAGGGPRPAGGLPSPAGGGQSPAGGPTSMAGSDFHKYARLDHVYTKGLISESKVIPDATTDHRPVVTTVRAGGRCTGMTKLVSPKRRNFKAIMRKKLEGALNQTDWTRVYAIRDGDNILNFITAGIVSALDIIAPEKDIRVKSRPNLYLRQET
jgi:hypothetical protein